MNLIEIKKQLEKKNQKRNQLLGQKEMLMQTLKEKGFDSIKEAKQNIKKLKRKKEKIEQKYKESTLDFISKYEDLLND
jgi:hypothetical protein